MTITATHVVTNGSATDTNSYNTAAFQLGANELAMVFIQSALAAFTTPADPTLNGGSLGTEWTQLGSRLEDASTVHRCHAFWGISASPGASSALNILWPDNTTFTLWSIIKFAGVDPTTPLILANYDESHVPSPPGATGDTLALPNAFGHADNAVWCGMGSPNNRTYTPGSGYTIGGQAGFAGQGSVSAEYQIANDSSPDYTVNGVSMLFAKAVEVKALQVGSGSLLVPSKRLHRQRLIVR